MAKPLMFQFGETEFALQMKKVDRSKLYGTKEVEAVNEDEELCELATLADDGRTLIGRGGTGLGWLDADGSWCDKSNLTPINVEGDPIVPVRSSFGTTIKLFETATAEDYLEHNIRLVYCMEQALSDDASLPVADLSTFRAELERETIFTFPYSYRGGLEADTAFLLQSESGEIMMAVGTRSEFSFVGIQSQLADPAQSESADDDTSPLDFDMI